MKKLINKNIIYLVLLFIFVFLPSLEAKDLKDQPQIKVMLSKNVTKAIFSAKDDIQVKLNQDDKSLFAAKNINIVLKDNNLFLNDKKVIGQIIYLYPSNNGTIAYKQNNYTGIFIVQKLPKGILVVNKLPIEKYLDSVVPSEMPSSWPLEALKAQAVAARTFAVYKMVNEENKHYDVCSTTHCQVYDGVGVETKSADNAVNKTYGQIIVYRHKPILAAFHADSGGKTENSEAVWDEKLPYLRSVSDGTKNSPSHHWRLNITPFDFERKLRDSGHNIGQIINIKLSSLNSNDNDRSEGGGVKYAILKGKNGTIKLTGNQFRNIFGLKSTRFEILMPKTSEGKINKENIIFDGYGLGHRLGLSQWGAYDLAQEHKDYLDILYEYYTDVSVFNCYDGGNIKCY